MINEVEPKAKPEDVVRKKEIQHDESPAIISDHKFEPMGEWWTRCKHCRLAEAAHAESAIRYYGDDDPDS